MSTVAAGVIFAARTLSPPSFATIHSMDIPPIWDCIGAKEASEICPAGARRTSRRAASRGSVPNKTTCGGTDAENAPVTRTAPLAAPSHTTSNVEATSPAKKRFFTSGMASDVGAESWSTAFVASASVPCGTPFAPIR